MHFEPNQIYHVYNRGNNKQPIFFTEANYLYFLQKIKTEWKKYADVLCYCLQNLSKTIGKTLSSYTKAVNIQNKTTGNLFQKKNKAKLLISQSALIENFSTHEYLLTSFYYIHQNPLKAKLVNSLKDWQYSSYPDYYSNRKGTICNQALAIQLLELHEIDFKNTGLEELNDDIIDRIF